MCFRNRPQYTLIRADISFHIFCGEHWKDSQLKCCHCLGDVCGVFNGCVSLSLPESFAVHTIVLEIVM